MEIYLIVESYENVVNKIRTYTTDINDAQETLKSLIEIEKQAERDITFDIIKIPNKYIKSITKNYINHLYEEACINNNNEYKGLTQKIMNYIK